MSFNNTPITAKIKRTTKGGVIQQPLLDMGAPVKMKSPAKQTAGINNGGTRSISFKEYRESGKMAPADAKYYKGSGNKRVSSSDFPKKEAPKKEKKTPEYTNISFREYRESGNMPKGEEKYYQGSGVVRRKNPELKPTTKKADMNGSGVLKNPKVSDYSKNPYKLPSKSGKDMNERGVLKVNDDSKKPYVKKGGKSTGNIKDYKSGSQARRDEYTARGWKQDATTTVAKPAKTKKIDISNKAGDTEPVAKTVKLTPKTYEVPKTKTKNEIRKNKSIDKKQSKADKARANGNLKKAARKEKAIDKKKARMAKRGGYQGQASNAIKPS
tara:strand:- start:2863 stop:3840 length:978 start_codon:yes stop_codon:yes gene_type:complete